jgi:PknH-like extracellular domain
MRTAAKRSWYALALAGGLLVSGCTTVTEGDGRPAAGLPLRPLAGDQLLDVVPTTNQVVDMIGDPLGPDSELPEELGELPDMADGLSSEAEASPHECVGAISTLQRSIYEDTGMTEYASRHWELPDDEDGDVLSATAGVAAFPGTAEANDVFDAFVEQWKDCDGTTVEVPVEDGNDFFVDTIANVHVENAVLSADIETARPSASISWPRVRAIGVRGNCLVEIDISFFGGDAPPSDLENVAVEMAQLAMNRIGEVA